MNITEAESRPSFTNDITFCLINLLVLITSGERPRSRVIVELLSSGEIVAICYVADLMLRLSRGGRHRPLQSIIRHRSHVASQG